MVAKVISGKSIRGILHYNEDKVAIGEARLVMASGFAGEINGMSFDNKLKRFENLTMLTSRVKTNALHISLNFDAQDKLNDEKLQEIATVYMDKIGFGDQPYLVYRHLDAAHPHLHIATTNIKADGKRIDIHGIGRTLSEAARKELEKQYSLVKAEGRQLSDVLGIKAADIEKAVYGKTPTKRTVTNIVNAVTRINKFTSLAEFNAVLKQFNVIADRGGKDTEMYQKNGLIYSIINTKGEQVGVPIKASAIYGKPTLANLEKKFEQNIERRKPYREPLKAAIEKVLGGYTTISRATFVAELQKQNINVVFRQNEQGFTYGITFIDNRNKTVFNGSDLGKAYSAQALTAQFGNADKPKAKQAQPASLLEKNRPSLNLLEKERNTDLTDFLQKVPDTLLNSLLDSPNKGDGAPLLPRKKGKRRKGMGL